MTLRKDREGCKCHHNEYMKGPYSKIVAPKWHLFLDSALIWNVNDNVILDLVQDHHCIYLQKVQGNSFSKK